MRIALVVFATWLPLSALGATLSGHVTRAGNP